MSSDLLPAVEGRRAVPGVLKVHARAVASRREIADGVAEMKGRAVVSTPVPGSDSECSVTLGGARCGRQGPD